MLQELHALPPGLLECESRDLEQILGGPTLIHLPGHRETPLFVSVLMHGNETAGWDGVRFLLSSYLRRFGTLRLPRALSLFIANVSAAAAGVRHLPSQPDYNRVWPGSDHTPTPEYMMMQRVVDTMRRLGTFASLDFHNNTGRNPHYSCVNVIDNRFLHLATLFSRTVVYFRRPLGVQAIAMAQVCPAVTLECGKIGTNHSVDHTSEYLDACLHLSALPEHGIAPGDIDLFHTVAQVKVPQHLSFGFSPGAADILLAPELERLNFREVPPGTALGRIEARNGARLDVRNEQGLDVSHLYLHVDEGELRLKRPVIPSMLTKDETVIRQDCLCYFMERYNHQVPHGT